MYAKKVDMILSEFSELPPEVQNQIFMFLAKERENVMNEVEQEQAPETQNRRAADMAEML